ncbi:hypothetical protein QBC37DRAFT_460375 [Rhypophila decipiens]|uniref:MYND-type domain-containing protein n=1 Tax=Rhypophila decipiens TaxID=261697 RepID=A0AAN6XVC0_9PEZI|nr:hypothetical protein QBC37DRAFT_460375 [Rhypophila decipiens]
MATVPVIPFACANDAADTSPTCKGKGQLACGNCHLVLYCGKECQKAHWSAHKTVCKSPIGKSNWRPDWDRECRDPAWASGAAQTNAHNPYGGGVFLWGNVPAIDVLRLAENEGVTYDEDIQLLFAASGDLRNVVKTISDLPATTRQEIRITINDKEFAVVARNVILLLFVLDTLSVATPDGGKSRFLVAEALIHLWYSAFVPASMLSMVRNVVRPFISDVCTKIANKNPAACLGKSWTFASGRSLRLVLSKDQWLRLDRMLCAHDLTWERAKDVRHAVVLAPGRSDFRDRWDFNEPTPFSRIAKGRFREDGLLLPFGHSRVGFDTPNLLLFQNSETWLMNDKADPLDGWPVWEVLRHPSPAKEDRYGKLELKNHLAPDKFMRIEASNISDVAHLGVGDTLSCLSPLLQLPQSNPHATLISLFLNAVLEIAKRTGANSNPIYTKAAMKYLPIPDISSLLKSQGAETYRLWDARHFSSTWTCSSGCKLSRCFYFDNLSTQLGVSEKECNTIVEKWPIRLKLRHGQDGAQEEFMVLLGSNFSGTERYVEWKRKGAKN